MSTKITTELVKELRDATGISVMQCKRALEEADGDMGKALAILKKTSSDIALKKADRNVKDGAVVVKTGSNKASCEGPSSFSPASHRMAINNGGYGTTGARYGK